MRGLVLLLLGGGLIWAVLTFFPRTDEPVDEGALEQPVAEQPLGKVPVAKVPEAKPQVQKPKPQAQPIEQAPAPVGDGFEVPVSNDDLVAVGSLLVHRDAGRLRDWFSASSGALDSDLEHAVLAFALAAAGDRKSARDHAKQIASAKALPGRVSWALQRMMSSNFDSPWPENVQGGDPLELGMLMRLALVESGALLKQKKAPTAAKRLTMLFRSELNAPWAAELASLRSWKKLLDQVQAQHRWNPKGAWPSEQVEVQGGDSLGAIRKRYVSENPGRLICTGLIASANGIREDLIHPGDVLRLPTDEVTMLVDLDAHWLLYMHGGEVVNAYAVGIGAEGEETITGDFTIGEKQVEPTWFRRGQEAIVFGEEGNPLGTRYMTWFLDGGKTHFGFHGTWEPGSIGGDESQGCIRMVNGDVEEFFSIVPLNSPFRVQP